MALKFFYNGIKGTDGNLQKCSYSKGTNLNADTISIYGKHYSRFSKEIRQHFVVENNTDSQADYFEDDTIRVGKHHPLYAEVNAAWQKQEDKFQARRAKRMDRCGRIVAQHLGFSDTAQAAFAAVEKA